MLEFEWDNKKMQAMQNAFNALGQEALYLSHYELAKMATGGFNPADWKTFLSEPHISDYITQEIRLLKQSELRKVLKDISTKARSVGTAQTLSALTKALEAERAKEGPVFIYTYIPLTPNEMAADNIHLLKDDPFRRD